MSHEVDVNKLRSKCLTHADGVRKQLGMTHFGMDRKVVLTSLVKEGINMMAPLEKEKKLKDNQNQIRPEEYMEKYQLELHPSQLIVSEIPTSTFEGYVEVWRHLEQLMLAAEGRPFAAVLGCLADKMKKCIQELRRSHLNLDNLLEVPKEAVKHIQSLAYRPSLQESIIPIHDEIAQLSAYLKDVGSYHIDNTENVKEDEIQDMTLQVEITSRLLDLVWDKITRLSIDDLESTEMSKSQFELALLPERAKMTTQSVKDEKEKLKLKCEADLERLRKVIEQNECSERAVQTRHLSSWESNTKLLKDNKENQEKVWQQIEILEHQLQALGEEYYHAVESRFDIYENENNRKSEICSMHNTLLQHQKYLQNTIFDCNIAQLICDEISHFVNDAYKAVKEHWEHLVTTSKQELLQAHQQYIQYFDRHCELLPWLIRFNESNLERIFQSMSESYQFVYLYRERRIENEHDLDILHQEMKESYKRYQSSAAALTTAQINFEDPTKKLFTETQKDLERRHNLIQYRKAFYNIGEEDIDEAHDRYSGNVSNNSPISLSANNSHHSSNSVRRPELYFSLHSPLATPKQLERSISHSGPNSPALLRVKRLPWNREPNSVARRSCLALRSNSKSNNSTLRGLRPQPPERK